MDKIQSEDLDIHRAQVSDVRRLEAMVQGLGNHKEVGYFDRQLEYQQKNERDVLIATLDGQDAGYAILNWHPKYGFFKKLGIPEIQDLNVLKDFRRRGIASAIIEYCEESARDKGHDQMGIGVGIDRSYGPAQILYIKRGYVPDGNGVSCDRQAVSSGEIRAIDDQMCLMMVKDLQNGAEHA